MALLVWSLWCAGCAGFHCLELLYPAGQLFCTLRFLSHAGSPVSTHGTVCNFSSLTARDCVQQSCRSSLVVSHVLLGYMPGLSNLPAFACSPARGVIWGRVMYTETIPHECWSNLFFKKVPGTGISLVLFQYLFILLFFHLISTLSLLYCKLSWKLFYSSHEVKLITFPLLEYFHCYTFKVVFCICIFPYSIYLHWV